MELALTRRSPLFRINMRQLLGALGLVLLGLLVCPHAAKAWWNDDWTFRKQITIDAGPKGAALAADAGRMPVLLRLHDGNFKFSDAKDDGSDLRFIAGDDKTPLKFHIESYDGVLGIALVWLDLPAVSVSAPTNFFLYWGNPKAPAGADAPGTYDDDTLLVYHFATRNAPAHDQTAHHNDALNAGIPVDASMIGSGIRFDGTSVVKLPDAPSLAIAPGGALTWSAWVKPGDPQANAVLFARNDGDHALAIGLDQNVPYISLNDGTTSSRSAPVDALAPGSWHHLAITAADQVTLYVDGKPATTLAAALPGLTGAASLGGAVDANGAITGTAFTGELDELEISKIARSAGFIAAAAASQQPDTKLVSFDVDEEHAGWFSGGFLGVILKSVTLDGWVVIGILMIMAVLSWVVMVTKTLYVGRLARANDRFSEAFTEAGGDFDRLEAAIATTALKGVGASSLYRIYRAGAEELNRRFGGDDDNAARPTLSAAAIATLRAVLDRVATREGQQLNRSMVLLTIAISGGPFLGLLGTVVGVMITFAAIAASGDVNINAIAPGMAAALVATVAGLSVAIPALFGYNYLISRIKDATTDMHVFVDEFATRLAEAYGMRRESEKLAAE